MIGVWFINPDLDPGEEGPPYPLSVADLTALLFAGGYEIVGDYVPNVAFPGREVVRAAARVSAGEYDEVWRLKTIDLHGWRIVTISSDLTRTAALVRR